MSEITGVHFVGSSGTGKTTLAKYVNEYYGLVMLPSASRTVMKAMGLKDSDYADLVNKPDSYAAFQDAVLKCQVAIESEAKAKGKVFVSDRAFDHMVYASMYSASPKGLMAEGAEYLNAIKDSRLFFFVRPTRACHESANADGDRKNFLVWEDLHRFDGSVQCLLHLYGVSYVPVSTPCPFERRKLIDGVLQRHFQKVK